MYTHRAFNRTPRVGMGPADPRDAALDRIIRFQQISATRTTKAKTKAKPRPESIPHVLSYDEDTAVDAQDISPLFKLPGEIREIIWKHALSQTEDSKPAHFHIYDEVYDSCTYAVHTDEDEERRSRPTQISLLLTCRAVYLEALRYLYENTDFVLVLLAGRARPREVLEGLNTLGTIEDCAAMFKRMRNVNLVIQPGKRPNAEKYATRIAELLDASNNFVRARNLSLDFNFHRRFTLYTERDACFRTITHALYPLRHKPGPPITIQPCAFWPRPPPDSGLTFQELHNELPGSNMLPWSYSAWKEHYSSCSQRGFDHNAPGVFNPMHTWRQRAADMCPIAPVLILYIVLLPVTGPLSYYYYQRRKLDKGEW